MEKEKEAQEKPEYQELFEDDTTVVGAWGGNAVGIRLSLWIASRGYARVIVQYNVHRYIFQCDRLIVQFSKFFLIMKPGHNSI